MLYLTFHQKNCQLFHMFYVNLIEVNDWTFKFHIFFLILAKNSMWNTCEKGSFISLKVEFKVWIHHNFYVQTSCVKHENLATILSAIENIRKPKSIGPKKFQILCLDGHLLKL